MLYFHEVDVIKPATIRWTNINYNRNNATYKMLINICYFTFEALLPTTQKGPKEILHFKDEHIHRLFERFVLEYFRKHYPEYKASSSQIEWITDDDMVDLLPTMKSDIMLEYKEKILIIDTKYYAKVLQTHSLYNSRTIHSSNLYQIFTYVKNKDIYNTGNVTGMLLYAKADENIVLNNKYSMNGNIIIVKTLDLNKDFEEIKHQLDKIIVEWVC